MYFMGGVDIMKEKHYIQIIVLLVVSSIVALSYYQNGEAINLFSIISAILSGVLAVYSLFSSYKNNENTDGALKKLELLTSKIDYKIDYLKDDVRSLKVIKNDGTYSNTILPGEDVSIYVSHISSESELLINKSSFDDELNNELMSFASTCKVLSAYILNTEKDKKSFTVIVAVKGKVFEDKLRQIVEDTISNNKIVKTEKINIQSTCSLVFRI